MNNILNQNKPFKKHFIFKNEKEFSINYLLLLTNKVEIYRLKRSIACLFKKNT
jgi:hypothetical protein